MSRDVAMEQLHALMRDLKADREIEAREDSHQWQREAIPGTAGGRARSASPVAEPGTGTPAVNLQRGGPAGEIIHMRGTSVSLASGGADLTSETVVHRNGFSATTAAGAEWTYPRSGLFGHELEFAWDTFQGGGTVQLLVNGNVVRTMRDTGDGVGQSIPGGWKPSHDVKKGDTGKVRVTQSSGSAQDASWDIVVSVQEPIAAKATDPTSVTIDLSTITTEVPSEAEVGDLLLALVWSHEPTITSPSGWTRQQTGGLAGAGNQDWQIAVDTRVMQAGDRQFTWEVSGGDFNPSLAATVLIVALSTGTSVDVTDLTFEEDASVDVSVTPTVASSHLVVLSGSSNQGASHSFSASTLVLSESRPLDVPDLADEDTVSVFVESLSGTDPVTRTVTATGDALLAAVAIVVEDA